MKRYEVSLAACCYVSALMGCSGSEPTVPATAGGVSGNAAVMAGASGTAPPVAGTSSILGGAGGGVAVAAGAAGLGGVASAGSAGMTGGSAGAAGSSASGPAAWLQSPFVMDTWFWGGAGPMPSNDIALITKHGYQGFALSVDKSVPGYVEALAAAKVPMVGMFTPTSLTSYPTGAVDAIASSGGYIWLAITQSPPYAASDSAGDEKALELINELADECISKGGAGVALYPHRDFWMQKVGDAVRLASKAARPDVGIVFNQYHFMVADQGKELEATLQSAAPYLKFVTINGSDVEPSILPLGQGAYDPLPILKAVAQLDFHGAVGLQGYSISGDIESKLSASKAVWDGWVTQIGP